MESTMTNNIEKALEEVIKEIKESKEYQSCLELKSRMQKNEDLKIKIEEIKNLQKKYVRTDFEDKNIAQELRKKEEELNEIPIFVEYNRNLEEVNKKIELVKEELNDYFNQKFNILK